MGGLGAVEVHTLGITGAGGVGIQEQVLHGLVEAFYIALPSGEAVGEAGQFDAYQGIRSFDEVGHVTQKLPGWRRRGA